MPVLAQRPGECAEGVGLDHVGAGREVVAVHLADDVGPGFTEDVGASVHVFSAVVLGREFQLLEVRAGCSVEDDDALSDQVEIVRVHRERLTVSSEGPQGGPSPVVDHIGPFECLRSGAVRRLWSSDGNAAQSAARVASGSMSWSTKPRRRASSGLRWVAS